MRKVAWLIYLGAALTVPALASCGDDEGSNPTTDASVSNDSSVLGDSQSSDAGGDGGSTIQPVFSAIYTQILQPTCSGCHGANNPSAGLNFSSQASAYAALTGTSNRTCATSHGGGKFVTGGSLATSPFAAVVNSQVALPAGCVRMPSSAGLPAGQVSAIQTH